MPDTTAPAWWTDLYSPAHSDTLAPRPVAGGGRLPPPGQTVDLGTAPEPAPAPDVEPHPVAPEPRTRQPESGRPDYERIAKLERELEREFDMRFDDEPAEPDAAEDEPAPRTRRQRLAGYAARLNRPKQDGEPEPGPPVPGSIPVLDNAITTRVARVQQRAAAVPGRVRWLAYNGSAAGAGYYMHFVGWLHTELVACQNASGNDQYAAVILGAGTCAVIWLRWDAPTRRWRGPLPWIARIPLASAVLALGLYAPGVH